MPTAVVRVSVIDGTRATKARTQPTADRMRTCAAALGITHCENLSNAPDLLLSNVITFEG